MGEQENNEIKILIDALKYTSNIIVDLTDKLTSQEQKIIILENKLNKIQKLYMENNLKFKTIDIDNLNKLLSSFNIKNLLNNSNEIQNIDKNTNKQNQLAQLNKIEHSGKLDSILGDKNKIDKLIGSIFKKKNDLNQKKMI